MNRSIAKLKEEARNHEYAEEWGKAIAAYQELVRLEEEGGGEVELILYNRIGDLFLRTGDPAEAIRYYELAAEHYEAAGLYNGAIALCNKAIRHGPERPEPYLRLTRLTMAQGFINEACRWSGEYLARSYRTGGREAAQAALERLAREAPAPELWEHLAELLLARGEKEAALTQLHAAHEARRARGEAALADELWEKILSLDPEASPPPAPVAAIVAAAEDGDDGEETEADPGDPTVVAVMAEDWEDAGEDPVSAAPMTESSTVLAPLPALELETAADSAGLGSMAGPIAAVDEELELEPTSLEPAVDEEDYDELPPLPLLGEPSSQPTPEPAESDDPLEPLLGLGVEGLEPTISEPELPPGPLQPVTGVPGAAGWPGLATEGAGLATTGFVDLASLLQDEDLTETGETRYVMEAPEPSGDEEQDFLELLAEFRSRVEAHLGDADVASRYDLGLAFKEMGLYDEAISQFQLALRGTDDPLKIYEELGDCFLLKGSYRIALKVLQAALRVAETYGGELLGIYYNLGRCQEELGSVEEARDAYERVLALDLEFRDAADRLARL